MVQQRRSHSSKFAVFGYATPAGLSRRRRGAAQIAVLFQQHGNQRSFSFFGEGKLAFLHVDADEVAQLDLPGSYQVGQRKDNVLLDGPLQVTRSVLGVGAFFEKELLHLLGATEDKLVVARGLQDAL